MILFRLVAWPLTQIMYLLAFIIWFCQGSHPMGWRNYIAYNLMPPQGVAMISAVGWLDSLAKIKKGYEVDRLAHKCRQGKSFVAELVERYQEQNPGHGEASSDESV